MISLDKLVEIGFTLAQATDLSTFFRNVGYLTVGEDCVKAGVSIPANKILIINKDSLDEFLKPDSQEYMDLANLFIQNGNMNPNKGRVNNVILYLGEITKADVGETQETIGDLVDEFISVNGNWAQLLVKTSSNKEISLVAEKALAQNRLYVAQTDTEDIAGAVEGNIAELLKEKDNDSIMLVYHTTANESLAAGLVGIMANPNLGATGALYSTVTNITPEDYSNDVNTHLDDLNVTYYGNINAINGGSVAQYASPIVMGGKMVNGEDAKRRYIRFCLDILLKSKSIDFLKKKLGYEDSSADVLLSMLKSVLKGAQTAGLVKRDSIIRSGDETVTNLGFEIQTVYPTELREVEETLYNTQTYKIIGYYRDILTGRKVVIDLLIDPSEADKSVIGL